MTKKTTHTAIQNLNLWPEPPVLKVEKGQTIHTMIYGRTPQGRDRQLLTYAYDLLKDKQNKIGATFIVETPRLGATLYNIANLLRRKVIWLNPQINLGVRNQLMWMDVYNEEQMDEWVIDYQKAIRNGYVVIVDLEPLKYHHHYDFAVNLLLWHLRIKVDKMYSRDRTPHVLFVENSKRHVRDLVFFLEFGHCYDLNCFLWADSPAQFQMRSNYLPLIEMTVGHTLLNPRHATSDLNYYNQIFNEIPSDFLKDGTPELTLYRLLGEDHIFYQGYFAAALISDEEFKRFRNNAKKTMTQLVRESVKQEGAQAQYLEALNRQDEAAMLTALSMSKETVILKHEKQQSLETLQVEALNHRHKRLVDTEDWDDLDW